VQGLGLEAALVGHGPPLDHPGERAREIAAYHRRQLKRVMASLDAPAPAFAVASGLSEELPDATSWHAAMARVTGLEYLRLRGFLSRFWKGVWYYYRRSPLRSAAPEW
jgi:hypothetical protein